MSENIGFMDLLVELTDANELKWIRVNSPYEPTTYGVALDGGGVYLHMNIRVYRKPPGVISVMLFGEYPVFIDGRHDTSHELWRAIENYRHRTLEERKTSCDRMVSDAFSILSKGRYTRIVA
jgi:hypothetical protein